VTEALGALVSLGLLVGGVLLALEPKGSGVWGGWSLILILAGAIGVLYFLVIGSGRTRQSDDRGESH